MNGVSVVCGAGQSLRFRETRPGKARSECIRLLLGWRGVKRGEARDFYVGDIIDEGTNSFISSGGNNGSGRTSWWIHTDSIQQLQGRDKGR